MSDQLLPHGEALRRAIQWLSEQRLQEDQAADVKVLIEQASVRFDLTPSDEAFLLRHFSSRDTKD